MCWSCDIGWGAAPAPWSNDTAAAPFLYDLRIYRSALEIIGSERLVFGSDYPLLRPGRYVDDMRRGGLTDREIRDLTELNARCLLAANR